jgi:alpha-tubulin suppressor-like RCC1 family protein
MFISGESIYTVGAGANNGNWLPYGVLRDNYTPTVAPINNTGDAITGWVDLYSDYENAIALTNDGRVFAVGSFYTTNVWQPVIFPGGAIISKIFSALARDQDGGISYYAIDNTGKLYSWGNNLWGQLGLNNTTTQATPQLVTALSSKVIVDLAASGNNGLSVVALDNTGQIYTWGYNSYGASANGSPIGNGNIGTNVLTPFTVLGMNNVARISAGGDFNGEALNFTRVINNDGTSWATGTNYYGVLGLGNTTGRTVFTQEVLGKTNWVNVGAIAVYRGASYAIDATGTLYFCGRNHDGCFGIPAQVNQNILTFTAPTAPFQGKMLQGSSSVKPKVIAGGNCAQGYNVVAVIDNTGTLYVCGVNAQGQCGVGNTPNLLTSFRKPIGIPSNKKVIDVISTGYGSTAPGLIVILDDGTMMACGKTDHGAQGNTVSPGGNVIPVFQYVIGYAPQNINY